MKIYTKTGDRGTTALVGGKRVSKTHVRLEAYGTIDELSAHIGCLVAELGQKHGEHVRFLLRVQHQLFEVGAELATERDKEESAANVIAWEMVHAIEFEIDRLNEYLPPLKAFVLPGGAKSAALCHVARTVCRRAERAILRVAEATLVDEVLMVYVNRLSDYLFVLSRKLNQEENKDEFFWEKDCK